MNKSILVLLAALIFNTQNSYALNCKRTIPAEECRQEKQTFEIMQNGAAVIWGPTCGCMTTDIQYTKNVTKFYMNKADEMMEQYQTLNGRLSNKMLDFEVKFEELKHKRQEIEGLGGSERQTRLQNLKINLDVYFQNLMILQRSIGNEIAHLKVSLVFLEHALDIIEYFNGVDDEQLWDATGFQNRDEIFAFVDYLIDMTGNLSIGQWDSDEIISSYFKRIEKIKQGLDSLYQ